MSKEDAHAFSEELARRLRGNSLNAAQLAREAGVTRQYIQQIISGRARNVRPATRARILNALEHLVANLTTGAPHHTGLEQLAQDRELCQEQEILPEELELLRHFTYYGPGGLPCTITTRIQALDLLRALRPLYRSRSSRLSDSAVAD